MSSYQQVLHHSYQLNTARAIEALLDWDQETGLPPAAHPQRAEQLAFLAGLVHERLTSPALGDALAAAEAEIPEADHAARANLRELRRSHDRAVLVPLDLVQELARTSSLAKETWAEARRSDQFGRFAPSLKKLVDLTRSFADCIRQDAACRYDALLDQYEPGMTTAALDPVFQTLRSSLTHFVQELNDAPLRPPDVLHRSAPLEQQQELCRQLAAAIGFDFDRGRLDISTHPFCCGICPTDVRLTTRYDEHYLPTAVFGVLHEVGHGLYEQGLPLDHLNTPLGQAASLGVHESQSRLWENQIGRSRAFWEHHYPHLQRNFATFFSVPLDDWHFAINRVSPSLIRVEADEVTYCLHIILRYQLEQTLLEGDLAIDDLPAAWNEALHAFLGITPETDADGCLQDIHWALGIFGYFPTYALGNLYAAQLERAAREALPELDAQLRRGHTANLLDWLRTHVHRFGRQYQPTELIERATGQPPTPNDFLNYLEAKYRPLYGI